MYRCVNQGPAGLADNEYSIYERPGQTPQHRAREHRDKNRQGLDTTRKRLRHFTVIAAILDRGQPSR